MENLNNLSIADLTNILTSADIPTEYLDSILHENRSKKGALNSALGLQTDQPTLVGYAEPNLVDYHLSTALLMQCLRFMLEAHEVGELSRTHIYTNRMPNGCKLTKFAAKHSDRFLPYLTNSSNFVDACQELTADGGSVNMDGTNFLLTYYDRLSGKGRPIYLTSRAEDFMTVNYGSKYTSCYNFEGCHYNGTIAYSRDTFTLLAYTSDKLGTKRYGRSWLYVFPDQKIIVQPISYGSFSSPERKAVREYIEEKLTGSSAGWKSRSHNWATSEFSNASSRVTDVGITSVYFDVNDSTIAYYDKFDGLPFLKFEDARCLECGTVTENNRGGICYDCAGVDRSTCACCGERFNSDDMTWIDGEGYCGDCRDNNFSVCDHCNEYVLSSNISYEGSLGMDICIDCLTNDFIQCDDCGSHVIKSDYYVTHDSRCICRDCLDDHYFTCYECGDIHHIDDMKSVDTQGDGTIDLCSDCLDDYYVYCAICNYHSKYYESVYSNDGSDTIICKDCIPENPLIRRCKVCGDYMDDSFVMLFDGENHICKECLEKQLI